MGFMNINKSKRYMTDDGTYIPDSMDIEVIHLASGVIMYRMVFLGEREERLCAALVDETALDALRDAIVQIVGDRP